MRRSERFYLEEDNVDLVCMSEKVEPLTAFAEMAFGRFDNAVKDLTEKEIEWKPVEEANSIRWILTHLSQEWNMGIPRIFKGDPNYKPRNWPDDYVGNKTYSLKKILEDLVKGRTAVMDGLGKVTPAELDADIPLWGGTRKRRVGLMTYLLEIVHHEGQIAYIRGAIGRRRQTDTHFLK